MKDHLSWARVTFPGDPFRRTYEYYVPQDMRIRVGFHVMVPVKRQGELALATVVSRSRFRTYWGRHHSILGRVGGP